MTNNIVWMVERKGSISQTSPQRHTAIQRAAEALSRKVVDAATVEVLNEALARLTLLVYEHGDDGQLVNVDSATGKLLIPLPWGKKGYTKWGLSDSEADAMRLIMLTRMRVGLPLFHFDRSRRAWFLNLAEYPDGGPVLAQLKEWEISGAEYRQARAKGKR